MKTALFVFCLALLGAKAHAALDYGIELGPRQQSGDIAAWNFSANPQIGFQGGLFAHIPLEAGPTHFRTGILYTQRPLESESNVTGARIKYNLDYLDIPLHFLIKAHEKFGFYFGFNAAINIAKSCSGDPACKVSDVDTPYFPMVFGAAVKFNPKWGLDFYLEGANGSVAWGLGNYKAVGLNLMFSLD
ncbi:MAG: outer membrane beta-barrel protein [Bdellovibrionales bacterium]|nr:outer membrane beta-barrel protein [Bdellovibrionales bacterium]